jgi:hypothetical protein
MEIVMSEQTIPQIKIEITPRELALIQFALSERARQLDNRPAGRQLASENRQLAEKLEQAEAVTS